MRGDKILAIHSAVFVLPDDFEGGVREALENLLQYHVHHDKVNVCPSTNTMGILSDEQMDLHGKIMTKQLSKLWDPYNQDQKFCGSISLHQWEEQQRDEFVLVKKDNIHKEAS